MSARKVYNEGVAYGSTKRAEIADFINHFPKVKEDFIMDLCDRWEPYIIGNNIRFQLVSYELCGATYGIQLNIRANRPDWEIITYEDSGYSKGKILVEGEDFHKLNGLLCGFSPSRYDFG